MKCARGTYSDELKPTSCTDCAEGKFNDQEGSVSCSMCIGGTYRAASAAPDANPACENCGMGK